MNQARHSGARASANPESPQQLPDSGFDASRRPGMTIRDDGNDVVPEWQLPGGQIKFDCSICGVQYFGEKHIGSHLTQIKIITLAVSSHQRGGSRSSRTRGGMRWTREYR